MIVSRSRTIHSVTPLTNVETVMNESDDLDIKRLSFDYKMTFENQLEKVLSSIS